MDLRFLQFKFLTLNRLCTINCVGGRISMQNGGNVPIRFWGHLLLISFDYS